VEKGTAYSYYYVDAKRADGSLASPKVRHRIGRVPEEMSERAAEREHDRIMQEVNRERGSVAPVKKGQLFRDALPICSLSRCRFHTRLSRAIVVPDRTHL
jgi:hypothetical protein